MAQEKEFILAGVSSKITITKGLQIEPEKVACQILTSADYDGTTDEIKLQQSNDGINWNDITDNSGNVLEVVLAAAGGAVQSYLLLTSIFFAENIRAYYTQVDGTVGTITIFTALKK